MEAVADFTLTFDFLIWIRRRKDSLFQTHGIVATFRHDDLHERDFSMRSEAMASYLCYYVMVVCTWPLRSSQCIVLVFFLLLHPRSLPPITRDLGRISIASKQ